MAVSARKVELSKSIVKKSTEPLSQISVQLSTLQIFPHYIQYTQWKKNKNEAECKMVVGFFLNAEKELQETQRVNQRRENVRQSILLLSNATRNLGRTN